MSYYLGEEDIQLDFVNDTHWDKLTRVLVSQPAALGPDDLNDLQYIASGGARRFLE